jgi:membrane dipeptidase
LPAPPYRDHPADPSAWAKELGITREAVEVYLSSDVIDLHIDSFIWHRLFGYALTRRHGRGLFNGRFFSQVDFPRILEARITGATWAITTNPVRTAEGRAVALQENLRSLCSLLEHADGFQVVRSAAEYRQARSRGLHGAFIGVQGASAFGDDLSLFDRLEPGLMIRVTLLHLYRSRLGTSSAPPHFNEDSGLSELGHGFVSRLNERHIFVDLAHISKNGFWDAVRAHDPSQPLLVSHTGVSGVWPHWRNLDDRQLYAIADTGGTVGIMYHVPFLTPSYGASGLEAVLLHMQHVVNTVGDEHVSLGSDWDGMIITPRDMPTCLELPRLVQGMLERKWSAERIKKILGGNFLRALSDLRG